MYAERYHLSFSLLGSLQNNLNKILLLFVGLFLFILPIPHTLTIRESALFISLIILFILLRRSGAEIPKYFSSLKVQVALYFIFIAWVLIVALFISKDTTWALHEIKTQWVMGSLSLVFGLGLAAISRKGIIKISAVVAIMFWTLAVHVLAINVDGIYCIITNTCAANASNGLTAMTAGVGGLTIGPIDGSLLTSLFFVFLISESIVRIVYKKRFIKAPWPLIVIFLLLVAGSSFLTGMRNIVEIPAIIAGAILILFFAGGEARRKALLASLIILPLCFAVLAFTYKSDSRWGELKDSLDLVMQEEEPATILAFASDFVFPTLPDNRPVNRSNFIRFVKYRVGVDIIRNYPLGIGFGRNAFGHYLQGRYNRGVGYNSDSSMMDIAIGAGLPGVGLFLAFIISIIVISLRAFIKKRDFYALLLSLIIICFSARMVFDSVLRDHLLVMFLFITGVLSVGVSLMGVVPMLDLRSKDSTYDGISAHNRKIKAA